VSGDGCSSTCYVEAGYTCSGGYWNTPDKCKGLCGDGRVLSGEACDDGNTYTGDGCDCKCVVEKGW